ncbi:MAG: 5-methyltetrahydropteroyltriglutamate--homocysteine S-methyltransferase [Alphaproteobacteria bacterium]
MVASANLGFPRMGPNRELKKALESYWSGKTTEADLLQTAAERRAQSWKLQKDMGIDFIPSNDFSLYDQVLDMTVLLGAIPPRFKHRGGNVSLDTYFAMARGAQKDGIDVHAEEMTKWFDTNYHYIVPTLEENQGFALSSDKPFAEYREAKELGIETRPVIIGPITYLLSGKMNKSDKSPLSLLDNILPVYAEILQKFKEEGAEWVQIDEPYLVMDLSAEEKSAFQRAYEALALSTPGLKKIIATYFGELDENLAVASSLPVHALHIDVVRSPEQLEKVLDAVDGMDLSIGVVDGRNIWRNDLDNSLKILERAVETEGADRIIVAPSCSLLHTPYDLDNEVKMDAEIKNWMAFAKQKTAEIATLTKGLKEGRDAIKAELEASNAAVASRKTSAKIHNKAVQEREAAITADMAHRHSPYPVRAEKQRAILNLPAYPTTTIGSFPQTPEVRKTRAGYRKGAVSEADYKKFMNEEIERVVRYQEEIDIDVLVHGEAERNDMVEYFGEQLEGYVFSQNGWVQSYGSRCVKPPIIFGDISRPKPMTVDWTIYAQSLTKRFMKGMLTGPVTILQWSFVRDDQPRKTTCRQIGLAIRDEVVDLEKAGIKIIQIDEPAIREGLPLRRKGWKEYLDWSVECFRLSASGVADETQIHTHMCYADFNNIIEAVGDMDADVISIETSRSKMELLDAFTTYKYPNEIGPGVYDIHSPRIPSREEMVELLNLAKKDLAVEQIWVNPDCGLKTRKWDEVKPALKLMVEAAKELRQAS